MRGTDESFLAAAAAFAVCGSRKRTHDAQHTAHNTQHTQSLFDTYRLSLATRRMTLDAINPGELTGFLMNYDFEIQVCGKRSLSQNAISPGELTGFFMNYNINFSKSWLKWTAYYMLALWHVCMCVWCVCCHDPSPAKPLHTLPDP